MLKQSTFFKFTTGFKLFWTPCLVIAGLILNMLTVAVFCRRNVRKFCMAWSMITLAVSDTAVLLIPVLINWIDETQFNFYLVNNTIWCNLHGYVDLVFCAICSWTIILISMERWFAVCRPWLKTTVFTNRRMLLAILSILTLSILMFVYFPLSLRIVTVETAFNQTIKECQIVHDKVYEGFGIVSIFAVYVIPFILLAILNFMIIFKLRQRASKFNKRFNTATSMNNRSTMASGNLRPSQSTEVQISLTSSNSATTIKTSVTANYSKADHNLSITLVTVALTFMVLTFPFQLNWFYENFFQRASSSNAANISELVGNEKQNNQSEPIFSLSDLDIREITFGIKHLNYLINFFLYSAVSKMFRKEFLEMMSDWGLFSKISWMRSCISIRNKDLGDEETDSSMAELAFSVKALRDLRHPHSKSNYFRFRLKPSYCCLYFRSIRNKTDSRLNAHNTRSTRSMPANMENKNQIEDVHVKDTD
nr:G protein-coupled receptor [Proales similis]